MSDIPSRRLGPWVELANPEGPAPLVVLCDHAGRELPDEVRGLGVRDVNLARHIGWDIGAADLSRCLAVRLEAPALLDHASRLLIDPNRRPWTPTSILEVSDGCVVPGNQGLGAAAAAARVRAFFLPYHRAVARLLGRFARRKIVPAIVAIHSFTPRFNGVERPWHIGVLWREDRRLAAPVLEALRARGDLVVGENQPYSGLAEFGYTIEFHAQRAGLPHVMFEIRQNEIETPERAWHYAEIIAAALAPALADPSLHVRQPPATQARWRRYGFAAMEA